MCNKIIKLIGMFFALVLLGACGGGGGGGVNFTDSLISVDLAAGAYIIVANSFDPVTGSYTLETTF